jgi:hypothetical protein
LLRASEKEKSVVAFKKQKVEQFSSLSLEHLQDMLMDSSDWTQAERAQVVGNFFQSIEKPMPISVQYMMYS